MNAHRIAASPWKPARNVDAADRSSCVGQETIKQMSLSHTQKMKTISSQLTEMAMKTAAQYRALASLARQTAAYNPDRSWKLLGEAERWELLAEEELASYFVGRNV